MKCKHALTLVQDFVDGQLGSGDHRRLEAHINDCRACAAEVNAYRRIALMLDDTLEYEPVPRGFSDRVIGLLKASGQIRHRRRQGALSRPAFRAPLAAAAVFIVILAIFPTTVGMLEALVGKGTVLVADTYIELQEKAPDVGVFTKTVITLQKNLHMLKTVALAGVSLIVRAGELFMIPALALLLTLGVGVMWLMRARRNASHVSLSI
jgi:anti-sigma-K factor RskA